MRPSSYLAGIVHHDSPDDLFACVASLQRQSFPALHTLVIDHGLAATEVQRIDTLGGSISVLATPNEGYAGGANRILEVARDHGVDFALILNPDVVLDPEFAQRLCEAMTGDVKVAIASGKLLRPDRKTIDSAGITIGPARRPRDRGSEEPDTGQYDRREEVFAVCGAAMCIRVDAAAALAIEGEVFDEDFVSYYEDTDLCWRARQLGMTVLYEPSAIAVHRRGWRREDRYRIPITMRRHSFKNHYLQVIKNENLVDFAINLPVLLVREGLRFGFAACRDRDVLPAYTSAVGAIAPMIRKRRALREMIAARSAD